MFNLFGKKTENTDNKTEKKTSKSIFDQYLSAKKDIEYLEDKWDDFVLKSLEVEFDNYKEQVDRHYPNLNYLSTNNWKITELKYDELTLKKSENNQDISIRVSYSFYNDEWELKYAFAKVGFGNSVDLDKEKFSDIIFQYLICWKLKEIEKERESKKESFQKMVDIIGKDVKRDHFIDLILS